MSLEQLFPGLFGRIYQITSPADPHYNCIAWAAGRVGEWWWPIDAEGIVWPAGVPMQETLSAFRALFETLGFNICADATLEIGFDKIALFANDLDEPQHAARQLPTGLWTSKLGMLEDITHELRDLEGDTYGKVVLLLKRPLSGTAGPVQA